MRFTEFSPPPKHQPAQPPEFDFESEMDIQDLVKDMFWGNLPSSWDYSNTIVGVVADVETFDTKHAEDGGRVVGIHQVWAPIGVGDDGEGGEWIDILNDLDSDEIERLENEAVEHFKWKTRNTWERDAKWWTRTDYES